jgi:hypothetical protein
VDITLDASMARTLPFQRSAQAGSARLNKALLLPIPRASADALALAAHISLSVLRSGKGVIEAAQSLTEVMLLASFLADAGYGSFRHESLVEGDAAMAAVFEAGRQTGVWQLPAADHERFAAIVSLHDWQLHVAPLSALSAVSERLERYTAGERGQQAAKKRA